MTLTDDRDLDLDDGVMQRHYGKYRGKVISNQDQSNLGRVKVAVPDVLGDQQLWAMPCVPYAGPKVGWLMLPPDGASVWVEFEAGDPRFPVWTGGFWGPNEIPVTPAEVSKQTKVLQTQNFLLAITDAGADSSLQVLLDIGSDDSGRFFQIDLDKNGILISDSQGASIVLNQRTVTVSSDPSESTAPSVIVSESAITLKNDSSEASITSSGIDLGAQSSSATVTLSSSGVTLANGAQQVALSSASVSINNGALMVQ